MREKKDEDPILPKYQVEGAVQEESYSESVDENHIIYPVSDAVRRKKNRRMLIFIICLTVVPILSFGLYLWFITAWSGLTRPYYYENRKNYTIEEWKDRIETIPPPEGCRVLKVEREVGMGYNWYDMQYTQYAMAILLASKPGIAELDEHYNQAVDDPWDCLVDEFEAEGRRASVFLPQFVMKTDDVSYALASGETLYWVIFVRTPDPDHWWQVPEVPPIDKR